MLNGGVCDGIEMGGIKFTAQPTEITGRTSKELQGLSRSYTGIFRSTHYHWTVCQVDPDKVMPSALGSSSMQLGEGEAEDRPGG